MIIEKETHKIPLKDFIEQKKLDFMKNNSFNVSEKEKINFIRENNLAIDIIKKEEKKNSNKGIFILVLWYFASCIAGIFIHPFLLMTIVIGFFVGLMIKNKPISDSVILDWLDDKKNEDLLKLKMFEESVIDEETFIAFSNFYSDQELVNLLMDKEYLKYNDIALYINETKERYAIKEKEIRLLKVVRCLKQKENT